MKEKHIALVKEQLALALHENNPKLKRLPENFIVYDTETFSECDIQTAGSWVYSKHPSTELVMVQWLEVRNGRIVEQGDNGLMVWDMTRPKEELNLFLEPIKRGVPVLVFNLQHERFLWENYLMPKFDFPPIKPEQWDDAAARARAMGITASLEESCRAFNLPFAKLPGGTRIMRRFCTPQKPTKARPTNRVMPWDDPEKWDLFREYGKQDVWATLALATQTMPLSKKEKAVMEMNYQINKRGLPLDVKSAKLAKEWFDKLKRQYTEECKRITGGITPTQTARLAEWLGLPNVQALTVDQELEKESSYDTPRAKVLLARQIVARSSVSKLDAVLATGADDEKLHGGFLYHGARTGREAGRLLQPHNLPKPKIKQSEIDKVFYFLEHQDYDSFIKHFGAKAAVALSSALRGFIAAPEGKEFVVADYSSIEARFVNWLAGQWDAVKDFLEGKDSYIRMASEIFRMPENKIEKDSYERSIGKMTILGCGFQMGDKRFYNQLKSQGVEISRELATRSVKAYRRKHQRVQALWYDVDKLFRQALNHPGKYCRFRYTKGGFVCLKIGLNRIMFLVLPSGRKLAYVNPKYREDEGITYTGIGINGKVCREYIYGGKLVENLTQASARDIMINGIFTAESRGVDIVGTVHDEIIGLVDENAMTGDEFAKIISEIPAWAQSQEGIPYPAPISAEGFVCKRYRK